MSMLPDPCGTGRRPEIAAFLAALVPCLRDATRGSAADAVFAERLIADFRAVAPEGRGGHGRRPEVLGHLDAALAALSESPAAFRRLGAAFAAAAPFVPWSKRQSDGPDAGRFAAGHGNALILGPGGAEEREDIRLGVSLMAPRIRYPDHSHPPDELYLVLSDGEWRQGEGAWSRPGIGGTVRNPPGIVHAMRAGATPLLAVWGLIA